MPRYIDADKLAITPIDVTDLPQDRCLRVVLWEDVEKSETVDAIPVEEIIKYIDANAIKYIKISSLDFQNEYKVRAEVERLFTDLINDWRKENESSS